LRGGLRALQPPTDEGDESLHVAISSLFEVLLRERQAVVEIDTQGDELVSGVECSRRALSGSISSASFPRIDSLGSVRSLIA